MNGLFANEMKGAEFGSLAVKEMSVGNTIVWSSAPPAPIIPASVTYTNYADVNSTIATSSPWTWGAIPWGFSSQPVKSTNPASVSLSWGINQMVGYETNGGYAIIHLRVGQIRAYAASYTYFNVLEMEKMWDGPGQRFKYFYIKLKSNGDVFFNTPDGDGAVITNISAIPDDEFITLWINNIPLSAGTSGAASWSFNVGVITSAINKSVTRSYYQTALLGTLANWNRVRVFMGDDGRTIVVKSYFYGQSLTATSATELHNYSKQL